jgi:hypothetical protein
MENPNIIYFCSLKISKIPDKTGHSVKTVFHLTFFIYHFAFPKPGRWVGFILGRGFMIRGLGGL